jgi:hypothetical protein
MELIGLSDRFDHIELMDATNIQPDDGLGVFW